MILDRIIPSCRVNWDELVAIKWFKIVVEELIMDRSGSLFIGQIYRPRVLYRIRGRTLETHSSRMDCFGDRCHRYFSARRAKCVLPPQPSPSFPLDFVEKFYSKTMIPQRRPQSIHKPRDGYSSPETPFGLGFHWVSSLGEVNYHLSRACP